MDADIISYGMYNSIVKEDISDRKTIPYSIRYTVHIGYFNLSNLITEHPMKKFALSLDLILAQLDEIAHIAHPQHNVRLFYSIALFITGALLLSVTGIAAMIFAVVWGGLSVRRFRRNKKFRRVFFSAENISVKTCTLTDKTITKNGCTNVYRLIFGKEGITGNKALSVDVDSFDFERAVINEICYVVSGKIKNFSAKYAFPSAKYVPDGTVLIDGNAKKRR